MMLSQVLIRLILAPLLDFNLRVFATKDRLNCNGRNVLALIFWNILDTKELPILIKIIAYIRISGPLKIGNDTLTLHFNPFKAFFIAFINNCHNVNICQQSLSLTSGRLFGVPRPNCGLSSVPINQVLLAE